MINRALGIFHSYRHPLIDIGRRFLPVRPSLLSLRKQNTQNRRAMNSKSHYEAHTAESYENAYFYEEGEYSHYLRNLVVDKLKLKEKDSFSGTRKLLDIGGGTGNFTAAITKEACGRMTSIVVDPFLPETSLLDEQKTTAIQFVKASAEEFMIDPPHKDSSSTLWRTSYHQILMKEVVHHFQPKDRVPIFEGMKKGFSATDSNNSNGGTMDKAPSLLIITRPQRDIDYPLWDAAREVWAQNQPHADELCQDLELAGFSRIAQTVEAYPCSITLERWQAMVKSRFWSTFANFTDAELEHACKGMVSREKDRIGSDGQIRFEDRLVFISAFL